MVRTVMRQLTNMPKARVDALNCSSSSLQQRADLEQGIAMVLVVTYVS